MSVIDYDVVLLPDVEVSKRAVYVSQNLSGYGETYFTLSPGTFEPHLSVYMLAIDEKDIPQVLHLLGIVAKNIGIVHGLATHYDSGRGYVGVQYDVSSEFLRLQRKVVDALNPIRTGLPETSRKKEYMSDINAENIRKYGWASVGSQYFPHITFTRFTLAEVAEQNVSNIIELPHMFSGAFTKLALFEMGDNCTARRKIAEYDLAVKS